MKPSMIIDVVGRGPGDEEDEPPFDDESEEDPEDRAPPKDPEAIISGIEAQLMELRRATADY